MAKPDRVTLLAGITCLLAFTVVVFGAYVRLSDAGLGCPDWPGCYGQLVVPAADHAAAGADYGRPVVATKAWKEMIHRYLASLLGLLILLLAWRHWRDARHGGAPDTSSNAPYLLVPLVMFQGLLGMWTVTLLLKPLVVSAHLLGGLAVLALLWWTLLRALDPGPLRADRRAGFALLALCMLVLQIALGGWTSANYAALACTDFPRCQGSWWPDMDFRDAFVLWRGLGIDYEFGVLDGPARTAVHYAHRIGALLTVALAGSAALGALRGGDFRRRRAAAAIIGLLMLQVLLGYSNVRFGLPLPVAVAHNAVAALLLLALVNLWFFSLRRRLA